MGFYDVADAGEQARNIATTDEAPPLRIKDGFQFFGDERDVAAAAEDSTDHARESDGPSVVLEIARVDENLERPLAWRAPGIAALHLDIVDRDVERMVAIWPAQFVSGA